MVVVAAKAPPVMHSGLGIPTSSAIETLSLSVQRVSTFVCVRSYAYMRICVLGGGLVGVCRVGGWLGF